MPSNYKPNGVVRTITAATATLTDYEAGGLTVVNRAAGSTITLPDATGTGYCYDIVTIADQSGGLIIQAPDADNTLMGVALLGANAFYTADTSDTVTLNGSTTGGFKGARVTLRDVAADTWQVEVMSEVSGTAATPFSAAVS